MAKKNKNKISGSYRAKAKFDKATFDKEARTVEVVFATETLDVRRYDWSNGVRFIEQLVCQESNMRMDRINSGAPLLNDHNRYSGVLGVLGVVEKAWVKDGEGRAIVRFSKRADVEPVMNDVEDGILTNISVGYKVHQYERQPVKDDEVPVYRAIDWEPDEISLCVIPADIDSGVRSAESESLSRQIEVTDSEELIENLKTRNKMPTPEEIKAAKQAAEAKKAKNAEIAKKRRDEGIALERTRVSEIHEAVRKSGLEPAFATPFINDGKTVEEVRTAIIDELAKEDTEANGGRRGVNIGITGSTESEKIQKGVVSSMVLRSGQIDASKMTDEERTLARGHMGKTLMDLAKESLIRAGIKIDGLDKMEIAKRSISSSTSDFPVLLEGANRTTLLSAYASIQDTWRQWCTVGSVSDFREHKRLRMGSFNKLDGLLENGEYKTKKITDADYEKVSIETFGNMINVSRKMIINDDLGAFLKLANMLGRAAARSIEIDAYALLVSNPTMADGVALFHATHGNLIDTGTGGVPSIVQFEKIRLAMARQQDKDSNDYIDLRPSTILAPIELGGAIKVVNASVYDPDASNKLQRPNISYNMFKTIVDTPRLSGAPYYSFASPAEEPVIEVNFLDGKQEPYMESESPFDSDGLRWKIRHDYGVDAVGWRGAVKNMGA